ncbi:unnamed protein product [Urochloa humidicola]
MSVAVCRGPVLPTFEAPTSWPLRHAEPYKQPVEVAVDHRPAQVAVWNAIQQQADATKEPAAGFAAATKQAPPKPYVHPLVRRSSSLMSQKSLEVCTESLGNETGSGDFTSSLDDDMACLFGSPPAAAEEPFFWQHDAARDNNPDEEEAEAAEQWGAAGKKRLAAVNYHRPSAGAPRRAFPPPLPSMSRRDGPCLQMRPRRQDGRLVVEAVAVRPRGYLQASRQGGRLRLSFVECFAARDQSAGMSKIAENASVASYFPPTVERPRSVHEEEFFAVETEDDVVDDDDEEEEKVEVVDRGTVVEVKVSTQTQTATAAAAAKVHRSTLVINKFVGGTPLSAVVAAQPGARARCCHAESEAEESSDDETVAAHSPRSTLRRVPSSTTSLAAAVAVASTGTDVPEATEEEEEEFGWLQHRPAAAETKQQPAALLFKSRKGDKQDLLQSVRQCRQLRQKPLFILEPYCIATS